MMRKPESLLKVAFMQQPLHRLSLFTMTVILSGAIVACSAPGAIEQTEPGTGTQPGVEGTAALPGPGDLAATPLPGSLPGDTGTGADQTQGELALSEIADNPEQFIGQTVTVRGTLGEVIDSQAFTLNDPGALGFDSLLVVGADQMVIPMEEDVFSNGAMGTDDATGATGDVDDAEIIVTGVVRELDAAALEQEMNYQFPDPVLGEYSEETVIIADDVQVIRNSTP
jgi:hypothetical protein